tara:strand:+ start:9280 stop:9510 length:231 start_codon:yes stop_codon:yes gene_type:complete
VIVLPPPPVAIRPADDIVSMLRSLADHIEREGNAENVFVVIEGTDDWDLDIRCFGPCDDAIRAAGILFKAARDLLP